MAAVIRLKRRSDEEPLEALVVACKRKKLEGNLEAIKDEEHITTILKFAGTVNDTDEDVTAHIKKTLKKEDKRLPLKHVTDVSAKLRDEKKLLSQENRFKVVNCFRSLKESDVVEADTDDTAASDDDPKQSLTILDVESHKKDGEGAESSASGPQSTADAAADCCDPEDGFVYDLYYASSGLSDRFMHLDDEVSIHPLSQSEWEYRDPDESNESELADEDEDDSNDENNWRNDYPDSDHSIDEDDMRMAMNDMNLGDGEDLSSDTADDDFVYGVTVDPRDVTLYGEGYANYKAKILHELDGSDEDEAYKAESVSGDDEDPAQRFS